MIIIDVFYIMELLIPPLFRGDNFIQYMRAPFRVLNQTRQAFYTFFDNVEYELIFDGQVIYLEHLLNDQFDGTLGRIYIGDADQIPPIYFFNAEEGDEPTYLFNNSESAPPVYLFNANSTSDYDFIVYVPVGFVYDANLMKYYINKYRCAGKRFKIQEI